MSDLWAKAIQQTTNALSANDILPNEKLIGNILRVYASVLGLDCDTDEYREAVRRLRDMFLAKIPEGTTLTDNGETNWREWLPEMKQDGLVPQRWLHTSNTYRRNRTPTSFSFNHWISPRIGCSACSLTHGAITPPYGVKGSFWAMYNPARLVHTWH